MLSDFAASRRAEATRKGYPKMLRLLIADPDTLLTKARMERRAAEAEVIDAIVQKRDKVSPATLNGSVSVLKSFFDYEEVELNWKKIRSVCPPGKTVAKDRAPTVDELRAALKLASPRERAAILVMASGGLRIGALPNLKVKDVEFLESGLGRIRVYASDPNDEYQTFVTPECIDAIRDYLATRERVGEKLGPDSLLLRDKFDYQGDRREKKISPAIPHETTEHNLRTTILRLWHRSGVRSVGDSRPFKCDHGLRKFARTQYAKAGLSWEYGEILLGHAYNYNKPSLDDLEQQYLRAVPFLSIDEKYALRSELEAKEVTHEGQWIKARLENVELRQEVAGLKEWIMQLASQYGAIPPGLTATGVGVKDGKLSIKVQPYSGPPVKVRPGDIRPLKETEPEPGPS